MANKRVVDGPGVWKSQKLKRVNPPEFRPEYANLIPLASANGTFECDPEAIYATVYCFNRANFTPERVAEMLDEFERVKLLYRWEPKEFPGTVWGYWVGIDKPGRLPSRSRDRHEYAGPPPDMEALEAWINGQPLASQRLTNGSLGFGFGSCFGSGLGEGEGGQQQRQIQDQPQEPPSPSLHPENGQEKPEDVSGIVDRIRTWLLGLDPAISFVCASRNGEHPSTVTTLTDLLRSGVPEKDIRHAVNYLPPYGDKPSFDFRDNIVAAVKALAAQRQKEAETALLLERTRAAVQKQFEVEEAERLARKAREDEEAAAFMEETLGD